MSGFKQRVKWRLEAIAYDIISGFMRLFPIDVISGFGGWLLRQIGPLTSKHKIARKGLTLAFPEKSEAEIEQLLKEQWDNTGVARTRRYLSNQDTRGLITPLVEAGEMGGQAREVGAACSPIFSQYLLNTNSVLSDR